MYIFFWFKWHDKGWFKSCWVCFIFLLMEIISFKAFHGQQQCHLCLMYLRAHSLFRCLEGLSTEKCCLIFNRTQKSCWEVETGLENSVSDPLRTAASKELYKAGAKKRVNEQAWTLWNIYCSMNLERRGEHDEAFPLLKGDSILLFY